MSRHIVLNLAMFAACVTSVSFGQSPAPTPAPGSATTTPQAYVPGVTYQADNPNYMVRNVFYFEGRVDWNLLKITTPTTMWEYVQRGIHYQDDLEDFPSAIADYQTALSMNSLTNGTCQILTTAAAATRNVTPAPCMFTPRLRLANLVKETQPDTAIGLFQEVLQIDALRLGVNAFIGEAYEIKANLAADSASKQAAITNAIAAYRAELALSPVTAQTIALTGDKANNAHVHWSLEEIYREAGDTASQAIELQAYLDATQWHSDTYAWRIPLARARLATLRPANRRVIPARSR